MARPPKCRRICQEPRFLSFSPDVANSEETVMLTVDEYEAVRLIDYEKMTQEQCADIMGVSRPTVTDIYESARYKIADCLVNGRMLKVSGGNYRICEPETDGCKGHKCCKRKESQPVAEITIISKKGQDIMRIAVTYENGEIFQHFGHTEQFKIYDVVDNSVKESQIVDTNGNGHGALAGFLLSNQVDALICGGIGGGAQNALAQAGIKLYAGVSGSADDAVNALLNGTLGYSTEANCSHHGHGEGHTCGEHGCH